MSHKVLTVKQIKKLHAIKDRPEVLNQWSKLNLKYAQGKFTKDDDEKYSALSEKINLYNKGNKKK